MNKDNVIKGFNKKREAAIANIKSNEDNIPKYAVNILNKK